MKSNICNLFLRIFLLASLVLSASLAKSEVPTIESVEGELVDGAVITLKGNGFTTKVNPKPLFFWSADGGVDPSPLGRKAEWDGKFNGELVDSAISQNIAPGSKKAVRLDHGNDSGAILGKVSFDSDRLYVWRKRYDDFDRLEDHAIRTRYKELVKLGSASAISVGMLVATADKSVRGKIIQLDVNDSSSGSIFYSNTEGNIHQKSLTQDIGIGNEIYFYAESDVVFERPLFKALISEYAGVFYTFNHKIIRLWGKYSTSQNNTYIRLDDDGLIVNENTQVKTFFMKDWDNKIYSATKRWVVEELQYQAGSINAEDGILFFWQNRIKGWEDRRFRFTTSAYPQKYTDLFQMQVSNGAQPGSFGYIDSLYVDDTWHRVLVCAERTWSSCSRPEVAVPTEWSDNTIKVKLRLGSIYKEPRYYFYVVNSAGKVNEDGFSSCPKCPEPPI